jgi:hypothetical protein
MPTKSAVERYIAETDRRVSAIEVLCEIVIGQVKGERRQLEEIRAALASPAPGHQDGGQLAPGDTSLAMLEG